MEPTATKNGEDGQLPENAKKECPVEASRETGQADKQPASTEPAPPNTKSAIDIAGDPAASVVAPPKIDSVCSSNTSAPAEKQAEPSSDTEPSSRKRQAEDRDEVHKSDIDSIASKKTKVSESYDPESALEDETAATQTSAPVELAWEIVMRDLIASGKVGETELDEGALLQLRQVPESTALACIKHLQSADLSNVRSKSAYLVGIIRRLNTDNSYIASGGIEGAIDIDSTIKALPAVVKRKLEQMFSGGAVKKEDIEPRVLRELMEFGEKGGLTILERYSSKNLSNVRNKTAFLIGVIKRYRTEVKEGDGYKGHTKSSNQPTITITGAVPDMLGNVMGGMGGGIGGGIGDQNPLMNVLNPEQQEMVRGMIMSNILGGGSSSNSSHSGGGSGRSRRGNDFSYGNRGQNSGPMPPMGIPTPPPQYDRVPMTGNIDGRYVQQHQQPPTRYDMPPQQQPMYGRYHSSNVDNSYDQPYTASSMSTNYASRNSSYGSNQVSASNMANHYGGNDSSSSYASNQAPYGSNQGQYGSNQASYQGSYASTQPSYGLHQGSYGPNQVTYGQTTGTASGSHDIYGAQAYGAQSAPHFDPATTAYAQNYSSGYAPPGSGYPPGY